jgi:hypothetical protein
VPDIEACKAACDAKPPCNGASYYTDATEIGGKNCWLKVLGNSCALPADATDNPKATLLLKTDGCALQRPNTETLSLLAWPQELHIP